MTHKNSSKLSWPVVADVWKKDVWKFQAKSGSSGSRRLFLHFLGKIAVQEMSGKTPRSPRHPSSRHPRSFDSWPTIRERKFFDSRKSVRANRFARQSLALKVRPSNRGQPCHSQLYPQYIRRIISLGSGPIRRGARLRGRTATQRSKKGSEKVLERVLGGGFSEGC